MSRQESAPASSLAGSASGDQKPLVANSSGGRIGGAAASICWLLAGLSLALVAGRIAVVRSQTGEVPFLSANDRSRWATVASLVDYRTYVVDHFQQLRDPQTKRRTWQSIDRVQHRDAAGKIRNYSSKPPLLATLVAIVYGLVKSVTGLGLQTHPMLVGRLVLAIVNLPLLAILFASLIDLTLRTCRQPWAAVATTVAITLGTMLPAFAISLNNHLPAAAATAVSLWLLDRQARFGPSLGKMFLAGIAIAALVANELPGLSLLPLWGLIALRLSIRHTLFGFLPGIALVAAAFFATNWLAHESLRPPYMHRGVGLTIASGELPEPAATSTDRFWDPEDVSPELKAAISAALAANGQPPPDELQFTASRTANRLRIDTPAETFALDRSAGQFTLRVWDDWYDYLGTYWNDSNRRGIDLGEPSRWTYTLHMLIGHHGIFLITPAWWLSLLGVAAWYRRWRQPAGVASSDSFTDFEQSKAGNTVKAVMPVNAVKARNSSSPESSGKSAKPREQEYPYFPNFPYAVIAATILVTLVCLVFYVARPEIDRNYGGVSVAFRWLLWQAPLWIFLASAAYDRLAAVRAGRMLCSLLLIASLLSLSTALENPWTHPWAYRLLDNLGWIAHR